MIFDYNTILFLCFFCLYYCIHEIVIFVYVFFYFSFVGVGRFVQRLQPNGLRDSKFSLKMTNIEILTESIGDRLKCRSLQTDVGTRSMEFYEKIGIKTNPIRQFSHNVWLSKKFEYIDQPLLSYIVQHSKVRVSINKKLYCLLQSFNPKLLSAWKMMTESPLGFSCDKKISKNSNCE